MGTDGGGTRDAWRMIDAYGYMGYVEEALNAVFREIKRRKAHI